MLNITNYLLHTIYIDIMVAMAEVCDTINDQGTEEQVKEAWKNVQNEYTNRTPSSPEIEEDTIQTLDRLQQQVKIYLEGLYIRKQEARH